MTSIIQDSGERGAEVSAFSVRPISASDRSAVRTGVALLVSALFLQRFSLPFGNTSLALDLVALGLILSYQFLSGNLLIQFDRLLWFLPLALTFTCSLVLNFKGTNITAYAQAMVFYSLYTLTRPSTPDQYRKSAQVFQAITVLFSCIGVAQFAAQFVVDGTKLTNLYGIFPDPPFRVLPAYKGSLFRSNAIFLSEASTLSQIAGLGILVEILEFRRPIYLLVMTLGFLVSYSGTGAMLLLIFLPLAGISHGKAGLSALLVVTLMLGLFVTGIIDLSAFLARAGEFEQTGTSGFDRFVSPFYLVIKLFDTATLQALLVGNGPGMAKTFDDLLYGGGGLATWFKIVYEYGILGSFVLTCFLASCLRRSRCPRLIVAAIIFSWIFLQGTLTNIIVLCTLNGPEPYRGHVRETD